MKPSRTSSKAPAARSHRGSVTLATDEGSLAQSLQDFTDFAGIRRFVERIPSYSFQAIECIVCRAQSDTVTVRAYGLGCVTVEAPQARGEGEGAGRHVDALFHF